MAVALVIGSGPGGSTAAMVLAEAGWDVVMFEKGPNLFDDLTSPTPTTRFSNDEIKNGRAYEGPILELEPRTFRTNDTKTEPDETGDINNLPSLVGGGTVHWDAKTPRFWDIDFQKLTMLGPIEGADIVDWPFNYDEIAPLYDEIEELIGVAGDAEALAAGPAGTHAPRSGPFPMPPGPAQYSSQLFADAATSLGLHPSPFAMAINSEPYDGRPACVNCGFCSGYGCPIHARVGGLAPLRRAMLSGRVELVAEAFVERVVVEGTKATGVQYIDAAGERQTRRGDFVVLAASPIESVRLALLSELPDPNGLIGAGLMFHWFTAGSAFHLSERVHAHRGRSTSHSVEDYADPDFPGAREFAVENGLPYFRGGIVEMGGSQLPIDEAKLYQSLMGVLSPGKPFGTAFKQLMRASLFRDRLNGISMIGEDLPQRTNRVDLDPAMKDYRGVPAPRVTYAPHKHELVAQEFYIERLTALCRATGAEVGGAIAANGTEDKPSPAGGLVPLTRHILGGLRMGPDAETGVLDRSGLFRGLDNVGVADGSVFPSSGGHNPTLTIMATALRNARVWAGLEQQPTGAASGGEAASDGGDSAVPFVAVAGGAVAVTAAALTVRQVVKRRGSASVGEADDPPDLA